MPYSRLPATEVGDDERGSPRPAKNSVRELPSRFAASSSRRAAVASLVDVERLLVAEDDAVGLTRQLDRREVVQHVLAHRRRIALERIAVAGRVRLAELDELPGREGNARHLRLERLLPARVGVLAARGDEPVPAAEDAARRVVLPVALARVGAVDQEAVTPDDAHPSAPLAGRRRFRAQLVLVAADREAHVELLDRVVARVRHQVVDRVHRVLAVAPAVRALVHLEVEPVLAGGPRRSRRTRRSGSRRSCRAVTFSGSASASARMVLSTTRCTCVKREKQARGKLGLKIVPFGAITLDRAEDAVVLGDVLGEGHLVEEDRPHRVVGPDEEGAFERDVEAGGHLRVRAGQVDRDLVALDDHLRLDPQAHAPVPRVVVEPADDRAVLPVGDLRDLGAEHPLRVVHPLVGGAHDDLDAVALRRAAGSDLARAGRRRASRSCRRGSSSPSGRCRRSSGRRRRSARRPGTSAARCTSSPRRRRRTRPR